uniref:Protein tyrosine phosphatase domain-containing protein 1 n=1 Tax=Gouania willdenowi TaxID=441366 RepID=A0A8C5D4E1_GOUWI
PVQEDTFVNIWPYSQKVNISFHLFSLLSNASTKYTLVGEAIRHVIPGHVQCSIACGGEDCKYDNPSYWRDDQQAIRGLYSSWVTDQLLATSRPSTEIIEKFNLIDQFKSNGIKTLINLQTAGEHATCGKPLEPNSGFSYCPEVFMENNIYFYNFGWSDYGVASLTKVLDIVKVMAFALQEGKIAVHCHAGLGRTGVLLACFLAYATRMTANQAILFVRAKRPNSIQTRGQLRCVRQFVQFLNPLRSVFACAQPSSHPVTLTQYLNRQRHILHGTERKELRYLPKIVRLVCKLLVDIAENRQVIEEDILEAPDIEDLEMTLSIIEKMGPEAFAKEPRLPGTPTLPRHFNEPPSSTIARSLSYSESDLRRLGSELKSPHTSDGHRCHRTTLKCQLAPIASQPPLEQQPITLRLRPQQVLSENSYVPFITLQSELSLEARRLLAAQALAVDPLSRLEKNITGAELNQGGAWERLCMERDPFILTGLMWAWLEQLKEPIISFQEAKNILEPCHIFASLQGPKETLTCILVCMAHMQTIPEEAFTWVESKISIITPMKSYISFNMVNVTELFHVKFARYFTPFANHTEISKAFSQPFLLSPAGRLGCSKGPDLALGLEFHTCFRAPNSVNYQLFQL